MQAQTSMIISGVAAGAVTAAVAVVVVAAISSFYTSAASEVWRTAAKMLALFVPMGATVGLACGLLGMIWLPGVGITLLLCIIIDQVWQKARRFRARRTRR